MDSSATSEDRMSEPIDNPVEVVLTLDGELDHEVSLVV
jgi:hypothetical protein